MTGPGFFNIDMGLQKTIPLYKESVNFKFRADAFACSITRTSSRPKKNLFNGFDETDYTELFGNNSLARCTKPLTHPATSTAARACCRFRGESSSKPRNFTNNKGDRFGGLFAVAQ